MEIMAACGECMVKRASTYLKAIRDMPDKRWKNIYKVALSFQSAGKPVRSVKEEDPVSETDTDEDDELVNPRYKKGPAA